MATYKKFSELPEITEASENTKVPVLDGNEMKLLNGAKLGGDAGIKTAIIKDSNYDNALASGAMPVDIDPTPTTYTCLNMTFEEAYEIVAGGEPMMAVGMLSVDSAMIVQGVLGLIPTGTFGVPCIIIMFSIMSNMIVQLFWTADGLSTSEPSSGTPV